MIESGKCKMSRTPLQVRIWVALTAAGAASAMAKIAVMGAIVDYD